MSPRTRIKRPEPPADDLELQGEETVRIEPARADPVHLHEPDFLSGGPPPLDDPDAPARPPVDEAARAAATEALAAQIVGRLNPEQARAVTTTDGPLLILAGAGSGKTRVLAHRVAYLIGVKGVRPWQILAVTFTNRAAGELRERIVALVGEAGRDVQSGTFHAVCARVLRRDGAAIGLDPRFVIYDSDDQQTLMKQLLREEDLPTTGEYRPAAILGAISRAKNEMVDADGLEEIALNHRERIDRQARPGLPGPAPGSRRARLRRHPPRRGPALPGCPRCARPLPGDAGAISTSTSTRTRTGPSTCG